MAEEEEVFLLDYWPSPFGTTARISLAEKGINYIHKLENLSNKSRMLLEMNPVHQKVHGSCVKIWMGAGEEQENGKKEVVEWSKFLERELGDKLYFGGDVFGFVDIALIPFYNWFIVFKTFANFNIIEIECPKLVMWGERCLNRDSVSKSLPTSNQVYQAYLEFKRG
ncbi:unnamed protein product [Withania somnifera]